MLAQNYQPSFNVSNFGFSQNHTISKVINYIELVITQFRLDSKIRNEKGITQSLVDDLSNFDNHNPFFFDKEHMIDKTNPNSPMPDIAIKTVQGLFFFHLEAKLFVREYLYGRTGGVERFKNETHGIEIENGIKKYLPVNGIIGYLLDNKTGDFSHWHDTLNTWIDNLIIGSVPSSVTWNIDDKITHWETQNNIAKYLSKSKTSSNRTVELVHIWIDLTSKYIESSHGAPK